MIEYKKILFATTRLLSNSFDCDVLIDDNAGAFENESLFVSIIPIASKAITKTSNSKSLMISIKYFNKDKISLYDTERVLQDLFTRSINVDEVYLNISNVEANFIKDEIGDMLDFLVYVDYIDEVKHNSEQHENMQDMNINFTT